MNTTEYNNLQNEGFSDGFNPYDDDGIITPTWTRREIINAKLANLNFEDNKEEVRALRAEYRALYGEN